LPGTAAARERLFARYLPVLKRWAHHRLPRAARALRDTDDLVQDTLLNALPLRVAEEGTLFRPFSTTLAAINATPDNGNCSIFVGFYGIPIGTTLTHPMTLVAHAGGVLVIGN
jgi:hypothetical protein